MKQISRPMAAVGLIAALGLSAVAGAALAAAAQPAAPAAGAPAGARPAAGGGGGMTNTYPDNPPIAFNPRQMPQLFTLDVMATDIEKSVKFYEDVLGMKVFMRRGSANFKSVFLAWPTPDGKNLSMPGIRLMENTSFKAEPGPDILLAVDDEAPYVAKSRAAGFPVERHSPGLNAFLTDPSGNITEMVVYSQMNAFKNPNLADWARQNLPPPRPAQ